MAACHEVPCEEADSERTKDSSGAIQDVEGGHTSFRAPSAFGVGLLHIHCLLFSFRASCDDAGPASHH
ncbi:unnamed protein product [Closterium sp. NIES-53]